MKYPKNLKYFIAVQLDLGKSPVQQANFISLVEEVLTDHRSWPVNFIRVAELQKADFKIYLASPKFIKAECDFSGLSCTTLLDKTVYINSHRWARGSKQFVGNIKEYRQYIINHETGHILGKVHPPILPKCKKGAKAPVMLQQTLGTKDCKVNGWPLKSEI